MSLKFFKNIVLLPYWSSQLHQFQLIIDVEIEFLFL